MFIMRRLYADICFICQLVLFLRVRVEEVEHLPHVLGRADERHHVIAAGGVVPAYRAVRESFPDRPIEVEVTSAEQARQVVAAGATEILLDNMTVPEMTAIVTELGGHATFEASGGLTIQNATEVAQSGVNFVAVGAITHSAPVLDIALDFAC